MFKLHAVQAEEGDALLLEYGTPSEPRFILVDGGPRGIYENHLRTVLSGLSRGALELVILSHVDNDHAVGLVALFAELFEQQVNEQPLLVHPQALWHNAFSQTMTHEIQTRLATALASSPAQASLQATQGVLMGVSEGSKLRGLVTSLDLPLNPGFTEQLVSVDTQPAPFQSANLSLKVVGPTAATLGRLRARWESWLEKNEEKIATGEVEPTAMADRSIPNLSSIMLVVEADGRRLLLTGDGRGDFLLEGLVDTGYLPDMEGHVHFDWFKVPHHGSDRNVTQRFFQQVTADHYVISANGRHDNPDLRVLEWILQAAKEQQRRFTLHVTNNAPSVRRFAREHPPESNDYVLNVLKPGEHVLTLDMA